MHTRTDFDHKRILVVDDEAMNRRMLRVLLKKMENIQVIEAQGGDEALDMARTERPDLILMDIMMPGMDGLEACSKLKQESPTQEIPVIFLSALNDSQTKAQGFEAGGVDYVSKPFEAKELKSRVLAHLALKEQTDILQGRSSRLEQEVQKRTQELQDSREELRRNYAFLQSINELLHLSMQELTLEAILDKALDSTLNNAWLGVENCGWIFLYNQKNEAFEKICARNPECLPEPGADDLPDQELWEARDVDEGQIIVANGALGGSMCVQGTCCVPFFFGHQVLGFLIIRLGQEHVLNKAEHKFLNSISRTLAGIVARKRTEQAMHESELLYRAIFETTQNATCIVEEDGTIGLCNSAFSTMYKLPKESIQGHMTWRDFVYEPDKKMLGMYRELRAEDPESAPKSYEFRFVNADNVVRHVMSTVDLIAGTKRTVVSMMDITEQKHFEAELERRAFYDTLTGLPNRSLFRTILDRLVQQKGQKSTEVFAVLFLDLDRFSLLNESLGHQVGDELLKLVADRLQTAVGSQDTICRFSSDEFAILLEHVEDYSEVVLRAEHIRNHMNESFAVAQQEEVYTTCCIGIVMPWGADTYTSADDVIRDAEVAMHRAKQEGLNSIKAFSPAMHEQTTKFLSIERELHQALKKDQFQVFYQPIIDLSSMSLCGYEGLIRWNHPEKGLISPGDFIPVAEETDLIIPIGNKVLELACHQLRRWLDATGSNDLFVSINLSAKQFQQQDLLHTIDDILQQSRIPAQNLKLEITESVIMSDVQASSTILGKMLKMGIQLAIDDFGTGYSSLSYLQSFPIDYIKIDRSFVWGMDKYEQNIELIRAVVAMGHNLEHKLIAEGIETSRHLQILQGLGCDMGQGFYFAKPMPAEDVHKYTQSFDLKGLAAHGG